MIIISVLKLQFTDFQAKMMADALRGIGAVLVILALVCCSRAAVALTLEWIAVARALESCQADDVAHCVVEVHFLCYGRLLVCGHFCDARALLWGVGIFG